MRHVEQIKHWSHAPWLDQVICDNKCMTGEFQSCDCWDFGADANSMEFATRVLGAQRPLGVNLEHSRLENMRAAGYQTVEMNIFSIPETLRCRIVSMSHFLEHLNSEEELERALKLAVCAAGELVYISGPLFEDDDYARSFGLKFFWGDWVDHRSRLSLNHVKAALRRLNVHQFSTSVGFPVFDSSSDSILGLGEVPNQERFDPAKHLVKTPFVFPRPVFQEFAIVIPLSRSCRTDCVHAARHGTWGVMLEHLREHSSKNQAVSSWMREFTLKMDQPSW